MKLKITIASAILFTTIFAAPQQYWDFSGLDFYCTQYCKISGNIVQGRDTPVNQNCICPWDVDVVSVDPVIPTPVVIATPSVPTQAPLPPVIDDRNDDENDDENEAVEEVLEEPTSDVTTPLTVSTESTISTPSIQSTVSSVSTPRTEESRSSSTMITFGAIVGLAILRN